MSALSTKVQSIKDWLTVNRKKITVYFVVLFSGYAAIVYSPAMDLFVVLATPFLILVREMINLLGEIIKLSNNQSAAAFLGAFSAYMFMLQNDKKYQRREIENSLFEIHIRCKIDNKVAIEKNISIIDYLMSGISGTNPIHYPFGGFCTIQKNNITILSSLIDRELLSKIIDFDDKVQEINQDMNDISNAFLNTILTKSGGSSISISNGKALFNTNSIEEYLSAKKQALELLEEKNIKILVRVNTLLIKRNKNILSRFFQNNEVTDEEVKKEKREEEEFKEIFKKSRGIS